MPQIVPISHLKNTSEISEMCHSTKEPIFITKMGMVIWCSMSMENYERMMKLSKVYKELEESESQIEGADDECEKAACIHEGEIWVINWKLRRRHLNIWISCWLIC